MWCREHSSTRLTSSVAPPWLQKTMWWASHHVAGAPQPGKAHPPSRAARARRCARLARRPTDSMRTIAPWRSSTTSSTMTSHAWRCSAVVDSGVASCVETAPPAPGWSASWGSVATTTSLPTSSSASLPALRARWNTSVRASARRCVVVRSSGGGGGAPSSGGVSGVRVGADSPDSSAITGAASVSGREARSCTMPNASVYQLHCRRWKDAAGGSGQSSPSGPSGPPASAFRRCFTRVSLSLGEKSRACSVRCSSTFSRSWSSTRCGTRGSRRVATSTCCRDTSPAASAAPSPRSTPSSGSVARAAATSVDAAPRPSRAERSSQPLVCVPGALRGCGRSCSTSMRTTCSRAASTADDAACSDR